jgi:N-methylhydantoinase B
MGAYPIPNASATLKTETDLSEIFGRKELPPGIDGVGGNTRRLSLKTNEFALGEGDVVEMTTSGGGGFGDPLSRDPELVARDLANGHVSKPAALDVYGVVVNQDGEADQAGTGSRRAEIRQERSSWSKTTSRWAELAEADQRVAEATGEPARRVHDSIVARDEGDRRVLGCLHCDTVLSGFHGNYRSGLLFDEGPLDLIPASSPPLPLAEQPMVLRRYCCPGCQTLISTETVRPDEPCNSELSLA